ncbi:MLO-like protein 13 isoform X2 [Nymphaea colorata]|uniref:MLO-like protein 13 isoform X2 n=1 Tax=Nymphaea colorata TaxID=210225 RepID=UPI00129EF9DA|nr:MLO-like protein 13 isoform X2 [Nymphaea colorata]
MATSSFEYTPTWVVAVVCLVIIVLSSIMERGIHYLGKSLKKQKQNALFEALQKLKDELMLLGFISLLLTVFQGSISRICIPTTATGYMLPCKLEYTNEASHNQKVSSGGRRLLAGSVEGTHCQRGFSPLLSLEALHQLHIFIFVLAVVHVIFCATTMVLGGIKIREWKQWEDSVRQNISKPEMVASGHVHHHLEFLREHAAGFWSKFGILRWTVSFFKQFYDSVSRSDYFTLRRGFVMTHCPRNKDFDFHKYMMRTLEDDFRKVVGIRWYLWLFVIVFLLLNVSGWHTYFWLSFLPLILLLAVGAKLEHIMIQLAKDVQEQINGTGGEFQPVKPSDDHFWFKSPSFVLYLIHFILFQNAFEIAIFFWIWSTFGFHSCLMDKMAYIVPRLIIGLIVQVLCSYSTLPLYALVSQMGSMFKAAIFHERMRAGLYSWAAGVKKKAKLTEDSVTQKLEMAMGTWSTVRHDGASTSDGTGTVITLVPEMEMPT